jgi:hypothetical protein
MSTVTNICPTCGWGTCEDHADDPSESCLFCDLTASRALVEELVETMQEIKMQLELAGVTLAVDIDAALSHARKVL